MDAQSIILQRQDNQQYIQSTENTAQATAWANNSQEKRPEYANQITNITRDDYTFYAEGLYESPKWEDYLKNTPVLNIANKFRVDFFIFKPELKKSTKYSFSTKECEYLFEKTKGLINNIVIKEEVKDTRASSSGNSSGYTVKLRGGNFNGKTPIEVLAEDNGKRDALILQANYLSNNLQDARFAISNRQQIAAIQDAVSLFDGGLLKDLKIESKETILWEKMKTPNNKILDKNGNTKARTIRIVHNPLLEQCFRIEIMNCMAPPVVGAKVGAYLSKATEIINFKFEMSEVEWFCFLQDIIDANQLAKNILGKSAYNLYEKYKWKH